MKRKASYLSRKDPEPQEQISIPDFTTIEQISSNEIWNKVIVGRDDVPVGEMIKRLKMQDWVNEGRKYLVKPTCPFCQKATIDNDFEKQLNNFFDQSFEENIQRLNNAKNDYSNKTNILISELKKILDKEKEKSESFLKITDFELAISDLKLLIQNNIALIESKIKETAKKITLTPISSFGCNIQSMIENANASIQMRNLSYKNKKSELADISEKLWNHIALESQNDVKIFQKKSLGLKKGLTSISEKLTSLEEKKQELDAEIINETKKLTSIQPTIDEMNRLLQNYGLSNFRITSYENEDGFYQLRRPDGSLAEGTLSEGEVTFVTFLYFYQLIHGAQTDKDASVDRIVVIDDPISSLDSTILFIVSTLVKKVINDVRDNQGNVKQLILLTHNIYFHKEASFIDCRTHSRGDTLYWILRKNDNVTSIQAYNTENPINNSYELLWKELKVEGLSTTTIQNTMRRIIENYFKILGRKKDDDIINMFDTIQEQQICRSLISWINDGSHCLPDDLYVEMPETSIDIYKKVFRSIFEKSGHIEHYNMMMNG